MSCTDFPDKVIIEIEENEQELFDQRKERKHRKKQTNILGEISNRTKEKT